VTWQIVVDSAVHKKLLHIPRQDAERMRSAINQIEFDPFDGDTLKMGGHDNTWRRRVGSYRIFYDLFILEKTIVIFKLERRGSKTY